MKKTIRKQTKKAVNDSRIKSLTKAAVIANISGLGKGDRAFCGQYGTVQCYRAASESKSGRRLFKVSQSEKLRNGANYTLKALREAIMG